MVSKEGGSKEFYMDYDLYQIDQAASIAKNAYYKYVNDRMFVMDDRDGDGTVGARPLFLYAD